MATSGRVNTGTLKHSYFYVTWQQASQNIGDNYTDINWQVGLNCGGSNWDAWYNNAIKINSLTINGDVVHSGTYSNISGSGDHQIASGTKRIYHDNNGNKTFNINLSGWLYDYGNTSGSENFTLNSIPRQANMSGADNFNDEGNPKITYNNPAGNSVTSLQACISLTGATDNIAYRDVSKTGTTYTFNLTEAERNVLRTACTSNSLTVKFYLKTVIGGNTFFSILDRTMTIINGNPTFSNFTYKDMNSNVTAITGNNQVLVKGLSILQVSISSTNKMIANKKSSAKNYIATIDNINKNADYSTSNINIDIGAIKSSGTKRLNVRAYDSRNNSTLAYKDITVYDYDKPVINASATRLNNFEDLTTISASVDFSPVYAPKNNMGYLIEEPLNSILNTQYRYREKNGTWTSYQNFTKSFIGNDHENYQDVLLNLDKTKSYEIEIRVRDKFNTIETKTLNIDIGQAIFFVSSNKKACYINGQEILTYDVVDTW